MARLITEPPSLEKKEKDEEEQAGPSEEYPGTFSKDDSEEIPGRGRIMRNIEKLGQNRQKKVVEVFRRLDRSGCSFRFSRSGALRSLWFTKFVDGREIRRSVPAPKGLEKLMWRAGISKRECL